MRYPLEKKKNKLPTKKIAWVLGVGVCLGWLLSLLFRSYILEPILISTQSMEPSLKMGESYLLNKWTRPSEIPIGEIVLCRRESGFIIGRILGRSGDRIQIFNKTLIRNGEVVPPELYPIVHKDTRPPLPGDFTPRDNGNEVRVPEGHFYILGDNRDEAMDSRFLGSFPIESVIGYFSL